MVEELIDKTELLERINLQNGIYGMTVDEVIDFIKKEVVVGKNAREIKDLVYENDDYACQIDNYECAINEIKSIVNYL